MASGADRHMGIHPDGRPLTGPEVIERVRAETDTLLLSFSCGKDSIAGWLALRERFTIIPFYLQLIPELAFVEEALAYYEDWFGVHIHRVLHPSLYRMLNACVWQPPERLPIIEAARLPEFGYDDVSALLAEDLGLPAPVWTATGIRAADSPNRRTAINRYGAINIRRHVCYPVWDMRKSELIALIDQHAIQLPVDYHWFGRSFDGIDYRFLAPLRDHAPDDFARILDWFPLAELELSRYEGFAHA